jgi:hypothetical protein
MEFTLKVHTFNFTASHSPIELCTHLKISKHTSIDFTRVSPHTGVQGVEDPGS